MNVEKAPENGLEHFGSEAWGKLTVFADMLCGEGEKRGLIGPREYEKLWTRHILNSTAILGFLDEGVRLADIGSGAGFPGIVIAIVRPDIEVALIETMDRRCDWLHHVQTTLKLENVSIRNARAEELKGKFQTDVVTARAVASVSKLLPLTMPLLKSGGLLLSLKGERVNEEILAATEQLRKYKARHADVHTVLPFGCDEETRVLEIKKK
ncbi:MAG: 16S rRNA (guanine(527)-N(7))-methyltransferase RsmG [Actinomycetaceae bacterium]|nr:16S rRNA (guanine(527)-N(7))-methyltransferase RsmG [Actinomycetaceae bacterium]